MNAIDKLKKIVIGLYIIGGSLLVFLFFYSPDGIVQTIKQFFLQNGMREISLILLFLFRTFLFLPSTLLILLAGFLLQDFVTTLWVSSIGLILGIVVTYSIGMIFSEGILSNKYGRLVKEYQEKIRKEGWRVIFFGSLLPIFPVDVFYYSAGILRFQPFVVVCAGFFGELPLLILYSYLGMEAATYLPYILGGGCILLLFDLLRTRFGKKK